MAEEGPQPPATTGAAAGERRSRLLRRVVPLLILAGLAAWFFRDAPKETTLVYQLQVSREGLTALDLDVIELPNRARARHVEYHYSASNPAPAEQEHTLKLKPGQYEIDATFGYADGRQVALQRTFPFDGEQRVTIPLSR